MTEWSFRMRKNLMETYPRVFSRSVERSDPHLYAKTTPENVYQPAIKQNRPLFRYIMRDLMLPGSGIEGYENLRQLHELAAQGKSTLILSAHFSNFDVPALYYLLDRYGEEGRRLFESIVFIAGRKLTEGEREVKAMAEMFNRIVISAKAQNMTPEEIQVAMAINKASQKAIGSMQNEGKMFLLYPTGTRSRLYDERSHHGIREIYNYIRKFDYILCCGISGLILPARDDVPMTGEYPRKDVVKYAFGQVYKTEDYLQKTEASITDAEIDRKQFVVDRVMDEIYALGFDPRRVTPFVMIKYNPYAIAALNAYRNMLDGVGSGFTTLKTAVVTQIVAKITLPVIERTRSFREALKNLFN